VETGMSGASARDGLGPFDPYWTRDVPSPRRGRAWRRRVAVAAAIVVAMIGAATLAPSRAPVTERAASVDDPARPIEMLDPEAAPVFALEGVEAAHSQYEARIDRVGGERRDALSVGALDGDAPGLRVELWREAGGRRALSLYVAAAETAAAAGAAVERLGATQSLVTLDGPVEWAELALAGRERGCAAFRLAPEGGAELRGVVCASGGANIEPTAIACLIEKLTPTKAGREAGFGALLRAPAHRAACRTPLG
jgi:hypothetical protein